MVPKTTAVSESNQSERVKHEECQSKEQAMNRMHVEGVTTIWGITVVTRDAL